MRTPHNKDYPDCNDRERVLREQDPEALAGLERHAQTCAECAEELRAWKQISEAASGMRRNWESPLLWPRIERALAAESVAVRRQDSKPWTLSGAWAGWLLDWRRWQVAAAFLAVFGLSLWGASRWLRRPSMVATPDDQRRLLTEQALNAVEKSQAAYEASIQKLAAVAAPKVESPATPRLESYREKLLLLDQAIADCRAQIALNRANPDLRRELLSVYGEKQRTLEQLVREER